MEMKHRIWLVAVVVLVILGVTSCSTAVSWYNDAVTLEESVKAQFDDNKNQYDSFWKKVKEVAQVPDKYKDDFKDLLVAEKKAQFGEGGSKAQFQWFKDRDINFDNSQYRKIQDVIESGRNDFKRSQTELRDKQRIYSVHVKSFWGRMWAGFYDMPSVLHGELAPQSDLDGDGRRTVLDYPIVTSAKTKAIFAEGEENEVVKVFE